MSTPERVNPFADLSDFAPQPEAVPAKPVAPEAIDRISQENGFPSRQPPRAAKPAAGRARRRYTTGRNQQINIKATSDTIARLYALADAQGVPLGEVLERALEALEAAEAGRRPT